MCALAFQALTFLFRFFPQVNNRKAYVPPAGFSPDDVEALFTKLAGTETTYSKAVRENRFRFIKKVETALTEDQLKEIQASFKHFDANSDNSLDKLEFKAASSALSVVFKDDAALEKAFKEVRCSLRISCDLCWRPRACVSSVP